MTGALAGPTPFDDLNELLGELVARVRAILGDDLVGVYLTGSFALGGADRHSDCDFLVVIADPLSGPQERAIRALHAEIPTRDGHWPHDLEGSYAPKPDLGTLATLDREWLYADRGWREMRWSTHCNTEESRWTLRRHGVVLAGADPREFVHEVPPDALRARMPPLVADFLPELFSWTSLDVAWSQRYAVATLCRMLYTIETGEVASKPAALRWALTALDPRWEGLLRQVLADRVRGWDPEDAPPPGSAEATTAFAAYAADLAARYERERRRRRAAGRASA